MNKITKAFLFFSFLILTACGSGNAELEKAKEQEFAQGTVKYKISYPYFKGESMAKAMLPKEMYFVFYEGLFDNYTKKGSLMKMGVMGSLNKDSVTMYLDFGTFDIKSNFVGNELNELKGHQTKLEIQLVEGEEKEIAGFKCKKAIGKYANGLFPDFDIYYTTELKVKSPNYYNSYSPIDGVLMEYEIERFGLVSKIVAESVSHEIEKNHKFDLDTNFLTMQFIKFEDEIRTIFEKTVGADQLISKDSLK